MAGPVLTIGYGSRSVQNVIEVLKQRGIRYLVDVRSAPYSRYKPEFSRAALRESLRENGITYGFLGKELGGRPDDPGCYDAEGHVDYAVCRLRPAFTEAIARVRDGWEEGRHIALMCSEGKPEICHRTKLIAPALLQAEVDVLHIDEEGELLTQAEVMARLETGQTSLFSDLPPAAARRSRGRYAPEDR